MKTILFTLALSLSVVACSGNSKKRTSTNPQPAPIDNGSGGNVITTGTNTTKTLRMNQTTRFKVDKEDYTYETPNPDKFCTLQLGEEVTVAQSLVNDTGHPKLIKVTLATAPSDCTFKTGYFYLPAVDEVR